MLSDVVEFLACPHCGDALGAAADSLRCGRGHSFDIARQGYVSLLAGGGRPARGDSADMVAARERFLRAGHYEPIAAAVAEAAASTPDMTTGGCVLELGAGTGYYLAGVLDRTETVPGLAVDASKYAARRAARAHERAGSVVCDVWRELPVRTGVAALVLNVFAPRNGAEMRRVLRGGGRLVVVTPRSEHLAELVSGLGLLAVDEHKRERVADQLAPHFERVASVDETFTMRLGHDEAQTLVAMGPSAWHAEPGEVRDRIAALPEVLSVTAGVTVSSYRPRP